jgi:hypothetical protein
MLNHLLNGAAWGAGFLGVLVGASCAVWRWGRARITCCVCSGPIRKDHLAAGWRACWDCLLQQEVGLHVDGLVRRGVYSRRADKTEN